LPIFEIGNFAKTGRKEAKKKKEKVKGRSNNKGHRISNRFY